MGAAKHAARKTASAYRGLFSSLSTKPKGFSHDKSSSSEQDGSQDSISQRDTSELPLAPDMLQSPPLTTSSIQEEKAKHVRKQDKRDRLVKEVKADLIKKLDNDKNAILRAREKATWGQEAKHMSEEEQEIAKERAALAQIDFLIQRGSYVSCSYQEFEGFKPIQVGTVQKGARDHHKLALTDKVLDSVRNEPIEDDEDEDDGEIIPVKLESAQARGISERRPCKVKSDAKTFTDTKATSKEPDEVVDEYKLFRGPVAVVAVRRNLPLLSETPKSEETTKHTKPSSGIGTPSSGQAVIRGNYENMDGFDQGRSWIEKRGWVPNKRPHHDNEDSGPELKKIKMEGS